MRVVSLNGAAFIFLQRGEKLKENEGLTHNKFPDRRYVIWPRANGWDVRVKIHHCGKVGWEAIAEFSFFDEDEAWQAAFAHFQDHPATSLLSYKDKGSGFDIFIQRLMSKFSSGEQDF